MFWALLLVWVSFEQVVGACSVKEYETKGPLGGKQKICSKGCAEGPDSASGDPKCIKCADLKENALLSKEDNCKLGSNQYTCMWKAGKCLPGSCINIATEQQKLLDSDLGKAAGDPTADSKANTKSNCKAMGCLPNAKATRCSYLAVWALIVIIVVVVVVVVVIIVVIIVIILKCKKKPTTVEPTPAAQAPAAKAADAAPAGAATAPPAAAGPPPEVGPFVVIKLGKQELKTKKVESGVWGQEIVFTGVGAEDDDVVFELHDNSEALLGSADVRIPDYVNTRKRAPINLKSGEADIGVLEVDIEIQVQEEPEVKITGIFFVDKFTKA